jgi:hypothetical protein
VALSLVTAKDLSVGLPVVDARYSGGGRCIASTPQAALSKETREKMATLHEHMAACLRSDKSISDCRSEMMQGRGGMMQTPLANTTSVK